MTKRSADARAGIAFVMVSGILGGFLMGYAVTITYGYRLPLCLVASLILLGGVGGLLHDYLKKPAIGFFRFGLYHFCSYTAFTVLFLAGSGF